MKTNSERVPVYLTDRQREAVRVAIAAMLAGERSTTEGETDWPMHVSVRDLEGAFAKMAPGGAKVVDPLDALLEACDDVLQILRFASPIAERHARAEAELSGAIAKARGGA